MNEYGDHTTFYLNCGIKCSGSKAGLIKPYHKKSFKS